jgi:hypothetical protein
MKYEAVFGDQSLFDGAPECAVIAIKRPFISGVRSEEMYFFSSTFDAVMKAGSSFNFNNVILKTAEYAERRIIADPKRWTVEDQKAGRLPEVGAIVVSDGFNEKCEFLGVGMVNGFFVVRLPNGLISINSASSFSPIETPEEKAERLEDEWVDAAYGNTYVFACVAKDEKNRLKEHLRSIYKAQISGDLPAPGKE